MTLACTDCGRRTFYAKRRCPDCGNDAFEDRDPGVGELLAVTTVHVTPDGVPAPNRLGLASFDGDANLVARIDGDLSVGDAVTVAAEGADDEPRLVPA